MAKRERRARARRGPGGAGHRGAGRRRAAPRASISWSFRSPTARSGCGWATSARSSGCRASPTCRLAPPSLLGLANLRGAVLPVVSLRRLLGLPEAPANEATRVIVLDGDAPVGFVVDQVDRLLTLPAAVIEHDDAGAGAIDPDLLDGAVKGAEGEGTTKILNPQRLLRDQFVRLGASDARRPRACNDRSRDAGTGDGAGAAAGAVRQLRGRAPGICAAARTRARDHSAAGADRGGAPRRDRGAGRGDAAGPPAAAGVVACAPGARRRRSDAAERGKVVVVSLGSGAVGIVVDRTREILSIDPAVIDPAPALLTRGAGDAEITSICRLDGGRRLVALLVPGSVVPVRPGSSRPGRAGRRERNRREPGGRHGGRAVHHLPARRSGIRPADRRGRRDRAAARARHAAPQGARLHRRRDESCAATWSRSSICGDASVSPRRNRAGSQRVLVLAIGGRKDRISGRCRIRSHEGSGRRHRAGPAIVGRADAADRPGRQPGGAGPHDPADRRDAASGSGRGRRIGQIRSRPPRAGVDSAS